MGLACDVYTKSMFHRGHGYPLWEPEPTQSGEVLIGDVGYVLEGGFYRLFNATLPADHAVHERCGVPDGYRPFTYTGTLLHRRASALLPGPICSRSVVALNVGASVGVNVPGAPGVVSEVRFKCADEQGAVLVLEQDGAREALHPCKDLVQYIAHNHESWHRFAQDVFRLDLSESDILFVSGCIKTGAWALAAATHRARDGELVFGGTFGALGLGQATFSVAAKEHIAMSVEHRCGPRPLKLEGDAPESVPVDRRDQCVFLHYYKCKRRPLRAPKVIRAASEEPSFGRSSSPDDPAGDVVCHTASGSLESMPGRSQFCDPVDDVLDYILDNTDAPCAVASDEDLKSFAQMHDQSTMDDVQQALRVSQPSVEVVEGSIGMLQRSVSSGGLPPIPEDPTANLNPNEALPPTIQLSLTPSSTPPQIRNQGRRLSSPGPRRPRSLPLKRRSCTPSTPAPVHALTSASPPTPLTAAPPQCADITGGSQGGSLGTCGPESVHDRVSIRKVLLRGRNFMAEPADECPCASVFNGADPVPGGSVEPSPPKKRKGSPPENPVHEAADLQERPSKRRKATQ